MISPLRVRFGSFSKVDSALSVFIILLCSPMDVSAGEEQLRDWTIRDSIEMRYFAYDQTEPDRWPSKNSVAYEGNHAVVFSPERRYFFVVTYQGSLERDTVSYTLSVFSSESVARNLRQAVQETTGPIARATFESSSSKKPGLLRAEWLPDGKEITFLASPKGDDVLQVFKMRVPSGELQQLTNRTLGVGDYVTRGGGLIFREPVRSSRRPVNYPLVEFPRTQDGWPARELFEDSVPGETFASVAGGPATRVEGSFSRFWIAPDGQKAISLLRSADGARSFVSLNLSTGSISRLASVAAYDSQAPQVVSVGEFGVKSPPAPLALWASDGRHVVLVGVRDVFDTRNSRSAPPNSVQLVAIDTRTLKSQLIEAVARPDGSWRRQLLVSIRSKGSRDELSLSWDGDAAANRRTYALRSGTWMLQPRYANAIPAEKPEPLEINPAIDVRLRESGNDPPRLIASDASGRESIVIDQDANLQGIRRSKLEPFVWQERWGAVTGWLLLPPNHVNGERLPLVIQVVEGFDPGFFLPDATVSAGYSAQAFAAEGFAVLQMPYVEVPREPRELEGPIMVERFDAAIGALAERGLIDRTRVGAIGHSRAGYQPFYAITHPDRERLAAVAILDAMTGTYLSYLTLSAFERSRKSSFLELNYEAMSGGSFWEKKQAWLEHEPTFNVDRVVTPALFVSHGHSPFEVNGAGHSGSLDIIAAFKLNRKPVEFLWIPTGDHALRRPQERYAEMLAVQEWMKFWLQGRTPQDPGRAEKWNLLRGQQNQVVQTREQK